MNDRQTEGTVGRHPIRVSLRAQTPSHSGAHLAKVCMTLLVPVIGGEWTYRPLPVAGTDGSLFKHLV